MSQLSMKRPAAAEAPPSSADESEREAEREAQAIRELEAVEEAMRLREQRKAGAKAGAKAGPEAGSKASEGKVAASTSRPTASKAGATAASKAASKAGAKTGAQGLGKAGNQAGKAQGPTPKVKSLSGNQAGKAGPMGPPPPRKKAAPPPPRKAKVEPGTELDGDSQGRAAAKAKWRRALPEYVDSRHQAPGSRPAKSTGIPANIYEEIKNDVNAESRWFLKFKRAGCNWDHVSLEEEAEETLEDLVEDGMRWATEKQIAKFYECADMAREVCEEAEADPDRIRFHKRFPNRPEYRQYHVDWIEEDKKVNKNSHKKRLRATVEVDQDQAMSSIMPRLAPPPSKRRAAATYSSQAPGAGQGARPPSEPEVELSKTEEEVKAEEEAKQQAEFDRQEKQKEREAAKKKLQADPSYQRECWMKEVGGVLWDLSIQLDKSSKATKITSSTSQCES